MDAWIDPRAWGVGNAQSRRYLGCRTRCSLQAWALRVSLALSPCAVRFQYPACLPCGRESHRQTCSLHPHIRRQRLLHRPSASQKTADFSIVVKPIMRGGCPCRPPAGLGQRESFRATRRHRRRHALSCSVSDGQGQQFCFLFISCRQSSPPLRNDRQQTQTDAGACTVVTCLPTLGVQVGSGNCDQQFSTKEELERCGLLSLF